MVSKGFRRNAEIFISYSYNLSHVFFLCKLEQVLEVFVKCTILPTHWKSYSSERSLKKLFYRCANIGAWNYCLQAPDCISKKERKNFFPAMFLHFKPCYLKCIFLSFFISSLQFSHTYSFYYKCFIYLWCGATSNILDTFHQALILHTQNWKFRHQL